MKLTLKYIAVILIGGITLSSCSKHPDSPGYEYMPDMYRSQAIEAYVDYGMVTDEEKDTTAERLKNTQSARIPAEGSIPYYKKKNKAALMMPFIYGKADLDSASANWKLPSPFLADIEGNVKEGKRLFEIMCMHCHGKTGQGDGGVVVVGDYNPPSPYDGAYKERSLGGIFHSQLNKEERWKVAMYVRTLQHGDFNLNGLTGNVKADTTGAPVVAAAVLGNAG